ncbi:hypothetical protein K7W03_03665 [Sphingobium sp. PNB]|uniref:hypothetical protein n=1 Tax=Sphingobium sp. PNB TaxID=863934 RepID=UPI001CA4593A|nr:hypothetical protein [Sphingobium sp. PNB]MCB4858688.1 hypothetical protein [Sphingobium sp. PNB]
MTDIESALACLRALPVDPRVSTIDAAVLDGLNRQLAGDRASGRLFVTAAAVALVTGILGSSFPGEPATAATAAFPLGAPAALAPSTLLAGVR